jgi:peptide/nickel transport system substrate-binding protein
MASGSNEDSIVPSGGIFSRRNFLAGSGAVGLSAFLAACGSSAGQKSSGGSGSSTLAVVAPDEGISWAVDAAFPGGDLQQNTQATLLRKPYIKTATSNVLIQDINRFVGYLATGYEVSTDGLVYTLHLRKGVRSAAGNPFTADDVLWSFERKFNTPTSLIPDGTAPAITAPDKQFKKIDDHTITITIADSSSGFTLLALLSDVYTQIYDSVLLKSHATAKDPYAVTWSKTNPNYGFGPYTVQSYQSGVKYTLVANPHAVFGAPNIKKIVLTVVADAGTRANLLKEGGADLARQLLPVDQASLAKDKSLIIPTVAYSNIFLNLPLLTNKAPFNDVKVRQAMTYAVPYGQIISSVYHGRALRRPGVLPATEPGYDGSGLPVYDYNPEKAKAMLAAAGHPGGVSYTLTVPASEPDAQQAAVQIQSFGKAAGFDVKIQQLPAAAFAEGDGEHTFQAYLREDGAITQSPPYELLLWTTPGSSQNRGDWNSPEFLAAVKSGEDVGSPFSAAAGQDWNKAEKIFLDEVPMIMAATKQPATGISASISGFAWRTDVGTDYSRLSRA